MLTVERVREVLDYDPETGEFRWKVRSSRRIQIGDVAGCVRTDKGKAYVHITIGGVRHYAHRLAWACAYGLFPEKQIDHIDGDGTNNRLANLRSVSAAENGKNQRKPSNNTSGVAGVYWDSRKSKWTSRVRVGGKLVYLGSFRQFDDAIAARKAAELKYGFHPNHGSDRPL